MEGLAVFSQEILGRIEREFTTVMGPLACVALRDKAAEFNESLDNFPSEKIAELVEEVSFEIQDPRRKVQFQRAALKVLREMPPPAPGAVQARAASDRSPAEHYDKPAEGRGSRPRLRLAEDKRPGTKA